MKHRKYHCLETKHSVDFYRQLTISKSKEKKNPTCKKKKNQLSQNFENSNAQREDARLSVATK